MQQINIKNEETYRLVQQLTELTGENMTQAIRRAVRDKIDALSLAKEKQRQINHEKAMEIVKKFQSMPIVDDRHPDDILYDEDGMPK